MPYSRPQARVLRRLWWTRAPLDSNRTWSLITVWARSVAPVLYRCPQGYISIRHAVVGAALIITAVFVVVVLVPDLLLAVVVLFLLLFICILQLLTFIPRPSRLGTPVTDHRRP